MIDLCSEFRGQRSEAWGP